jgi:hypothetical protein
VRATTHIGGLHHSDGRLKLSYDSDVRGGSPSPLVGVKMDCGLADATTSTLQVDTKTSYKERGCGSKRDSEYHLDLRCIVGRQAQESSA